ncbi:Txe/YoeB family addiction module toxin [Blautia massiliensis (ex Durand et al. 2017)]|jgi:toxin YoeB|uniref:Txe/YoeB family addiction module toxin n=1 Tax=Blautia massiliensis (ex Durand et al. 2017) TaxID=1737424 RepID=UPI00242DA1AE|nr:Txe/YoeB family addiction module toxin [Blautia massiliensis (ex Durand et al. 2017)]MCI2131685.1 Txe/YoeB family addiction module toxin [Eubacterium sp.]MDD6550145.1 Txe/YoeB family addiction module toxin [Blautia massiliensis (ex Durand et al. 2017)]
MRSLLWQSDAWKEYTEIQSDKALLKRVNNLIKDVMRNGYNASYGQVEMLKGDFAGFASVRIDKKNRMIFEADEYQITIIQCGEHYKDH